jgi:hypothetical protein
MFRSVCRVFPQTSMTTPADRKSIDRRDLQRRTLPKGVDLNDCLPA